MNKPARPPSAEILIAEPALAARIAALLEATGIRTTGASAHAVLITDTAVERDEERPVIAIVERTAMRRALRGGAAAVLPKGVGAAQLRLAIEAAAAGLAVMPQDLMMRDAPDREASAWAAEADGTVALTRREREVLELVATGASNKMIARELAITVHTVKFHLAAILDKLDAAGRTEAVARAVRLGLLML